MAHLPPKAPTSVPGWANITYPKPPSGGYWVDEFLEFSAVRRGTHRRSASDSGAYNLEAPSADLEDFDRLDDDQLMSMFSDEAPPPPAPPPPPPLSSSNPSSPSHNSSSDEKLPPRNEEDAQSECQAEETALARQPAGAAVDPKRVKRILANRQSAQRSRVRKLQYISELERSVTSLQTEVSALSPRVAFLDHQRTALTMGNSHLKQRIAALVHDKIFKDAHQEALKKEMERLREVYQQQNTKKMAGPASDPLTVHVDKELMS